jgi:hypothetical protein
LNKSYQLFHRSIKNLADTAFIKYIDKRVFHNSFRTAILPIPPLDGFHICSEFIPPLKPLQYSQFGLFAFVVLYTTGFSAGLSRLADVAIYAALH